MAYTALYRKFRPSRFDEVRGQEHIVTTLRNQIKASRIGHAYLFCGTRGTGKTSIAKILAKAVNCEQPVDGSPCNECPMCKEINSQTSMNVIEIDAASNNGVDNIREIIDEVQYSPTTGKYKVYIIDEVHMLSAGAFNALLKTLEEPPSYVIFILATTEVHKIPITILSRCQRYDFHRITIDIIADQLLELIQKEQVQAEEKAIRYIAKSADGSMRDALSLLDQCIAFYFGQELTYDKVLEVLGAVDTEVFHNMFTFINEKNIVSSMELIENMIAKGRELSQFIVDFIWYLRNLLLIKTSKEAFDMIEVSTEDYKKMQANAEQIEIDTLIYKIQSLSDLSNQIKYVSNKRVLIEIAVIKLCKPQMKEDYNALLERIRQIEKQLEQKIVIAENNMPRGLSGTEKVERKEQEVLQRAVPEELKQIAKNWRTILSHVSPMLRSFLSEAVVSHGEDNRLLLVFDNIVSKEFVEQKEHTKEIEEVIRKQVKKEVEIQTKLMESASGTIDQIPDLTKMIRMEIEYED